MYKPLKVSIAEGFQHVAQRNAAPLCQTIPLQSDWATNLPMAKSQAMARDLLHAHAGSFFNGKIMPNPNRLTMMPHCDAHRHHHHGRRNDGSDSRLVLGKRHLPRWRPCFDRHSVLQSDILMLHVCYSHDAFLSTEFVSLVSV